MTTRKGDEVAVAVKSAEQDVEAEVMTLRESAELAWSQKATLDESSAVQSFRTKMFQTIKVRRESYELYLDQFPHEFNPWLRIGTEIDGLRFCLDKHGALSVVSWECAEKGCDVVRRSPFKDFVSLGRVLAEGDFLDAEQPKCQRHASK